jgi:lysophospholipase L1-like esterase
VSAFGAQGVRGLAVVLLLSCSPATPAPRVPRTVVALGDSITKGTLADLPAITRPYPDTLQAILGEGWKVVNLGVAGFRAHEVRKQWRAKARPRAYAVGVVLAGANDLRLGARAEEIWESLRPTYEEILADGMHLVAVTATPFRGWRWDPWTPAKQHELELLNARISRFCAERGCMVADAYAAFVDAVEPFTLRPEYDAGDHLHPSQAALDRLASLVAARVPR